MLAGDDDRRSDFCGQTGQHGVGMRRVHPSGDRGQRVAGADDVVRALTRLDVNGRDPLAEGFAAPSDPAAKLRNGNARTASSAATARTANRRRRTAVDAGRRRRATSAGGSISNSSSTGSRRRSSGRGQGNSASVPVKTAIVILALLVDSTALLRTPVCLWNHEHSFVSSSNHRPFPLHPASLAIMQEGCIRDPHEQTFASEPRARYLVSPNTCSLPDTWTRRTRWPKS